MKNDHEIIVGLDIGTTKIACFIGQRNDEGTVTVLGYGKTESKGVERGTVANYIDASKSIKKAVDIASDKAGIDVDEVYVGVAGQHIRSRQNVGSVMLPNGKNYVDQEDIDKLINDQRRMMMGPGEEIIHVFPQTFYADGEELSQNINPIGVACKELKAKFHIVSGLTRNLILIRESVRAAGYKIKGVVLEPIASSYAILDDTDRTAGTAIVDIGGGTTDIALFFEGIIRHTSVIPLAGNVITNDIKTGCKVLKNHAEALKTKFGCCLPETVNENDIISIPGLHYQPPIEIGMKTLACIIKDRTHQILEMVNYEITESGYAQELIGGIVLTGGGSKLKSIKELTEFTTSIPARVGLPNTHLAKDTPKEIIDPMYSTGIGLLLYGIEESEMEERRRNGEIVEEEEPIANPNEILGKPSGAPVETPVSDPEPGKKKHEAKDSKGKNPFKSVSSWLTKIFTEENVDEDDL